MADYEVTVKFIVEANSINEAKEEAIFGMDDGAIAIGENSFVNVTKVKGE